MSVSAEAKLVEAIVDFIKPHLAGHLPEIQGAVLADLLAIWLAGHAPGIREEILALHLDAVRDLIPVNEKILFGERGHPADR